MSVLASLARAYDRLPDAAPFGYSVEPIGFIISLHGDGTVASVTDLRDGAGKKNVAPRLEVPSSFRRSGTSPPPFFLWDTSAFVLGIGGAENKNASKRFEAFRDFHLEELAETDDKGLRALVLFLKGWAPEQFVTPTWPTDLIGENIAFALEEERHQRFIHDRPEAKANWARISAGRQRAGAVCLVTGDTGPIAKVHPAIKGVWGAHTAGGAIVSFNSDAYESYGHEQGDNAPMSEAAVFKYATALNRFLQTGSGHRVQVGDASTVFWADASDMDAAALAEKMAGALFAGSAVPTAEDDKAESDAVGDKLDAIRQGRPLAEVEPRLAKGVRFHVLGLAPNAARLSVRFSWEGDFGEMTANYQRHLSDSRIEPGPREPAPPLWKYLAEVAVQGKRENVPPGLAGDWMRAILTGSRYPETLLATTLMRVRADQSVNALRAAVLKAMLVRNHQGEEALVALDEDSDSTAYQLGRLFAVMEAAQRAALGQVNAGIGDRYYAAASATPARVFPTLLRGSRPHLADLRKNPAKKGLGNWLDRRIGEVIAHLPADLPTTLRIVDQGRFAVGYYHEKSYRAPKAEASDPALADSIQGET